MKLILKNQIFKIISIVFFILSVIFYVLSCEGCYYEEYYECAIKFEYHGFFKKLFKRMILSSLFYCIYLFLCVHKIINRKYLILNIVYLYLFIKYHKSNWDEHGYYNRIFFVIFILIILQDGKKAY
jgi:hypothetical protein